MKQETSYARTGDVTGEGMNKGWVWCDGTFYTKYMEDTLHECRKDRDAIVQDIECLGVEDVVDPYEYDDFELARAKALRGDDTDYDLLTIAYHVGYVYFTEWEDEYEEA